MGCRKGCVCAEEPSGFGQGIRTPGMSSCPCHLPFTLSWQNGQLICITVSSLSTPADASGRFWLIVRSDYTPGEARLKLSSYMPATEPHATAELTAAKAWTLVYILFENIFRHQNNNSRLHSPRMFTRRWC